MGAVDTVRPRRKALTKVGPVIYTGSMKSPSVRQAKPRSSRRHITLRLCYAAMGVALLAVSAWVSIPILSVPFTLQTFAVFFLVGLLGTKWSLITIAAYILLGAVGVPVFSGFTGGIARLAGPTGGYILGFLLSAALCGPLFKLAKNNRVWQAVTFLLGLVVCYTFGTVWFAAVGGNLSWAGIGSALSLCVVPFVLPDLAKLALSLFALRRVAPLLAKLEPSDKPDPTDSPASTPDMGA